MKEFDSLRWIAHQTKQYCHSSRKIYLVFAREPPTHIFLLLSSHWFRQCITVIHSGQIMLASTLLPSSKLHPSHFVPPITVAEAPPRNRVAIFSKSTPKLAFVARATNDARDGAVDATSSPVRCRYTHRFVFHVPFLCFLFNFVI